MKRTRDQRIRELQHAQLRDQHRESVRARLDTIKTALHKRLFPQVIAELELALEEARAAAELAKGVPTAPAQQELGTANGAPIVDNKTAAAGDDR